MITDLIKAGMAILDKVIPDPVARDAAKVKLLELEQNRELEHLKAETALALEQIKVNAVEASSQDPFVRRWRPAFGWLGVAAFAYSYIGQPLLAWIAPGIGLGVPPSPDTSELMTLMLGLLGFGSMRTAEKLRAPRA